VQYGNLVDIGRRRREGAAPGRRTRAALGAEGAKVPAKQDAGAWPTRAHSRKVLVLAGCVQPSMMPNINSATARVLDAAGIQEVTIQRDDGAPPLTLRANGPVCLVDLPAGRYNVQATAGGATLKETVTVGGVPRTADFRF
jgi:hypothetical protein